MAFNINTTAEEAAQILGREIKGKTVLITGVSPGSLGAETARVVAAHEPDLIIIASRSDKKLSEVITQLPPDHQKVLRPLEVDLSSFASVRKAADTILSWNVHIDVMIQTAGVMAVPEYKETEDGIESQFAINHLGHFLLTALLKSALVTGDKSARIVTYTSESHRQAALRLPDVNFENGKIYNKWWAYGSSKACNILFAVGLAQRFGGMGLKAFAADPGVIVTTSLTRSVPQEEFKALGWVDENGNLNTAAFTPKSLGQGAATGLIAAFEPSITGQQNGSILQDGVVNKSAAAEYALDRNNADVLWKLSEKLTGVTF